MMGEKTARIHRSLCLVAAGIGLTVGSHAQAALVAHYTLDDLAGGIQNLGADGTTSNLSKYGSGTISLISEGIIGTGALKFNGGVCLGATAAGNAGDDLAGYPFTLSVWLRNSVYDGGRDTAMTVSKWSVDNTYWGVGVGTNDNNNSEAELIVRNTAFTELNSTGLIGSTWHHVLGVFDGGGKQYLYFDGKLSATGSRTEAFNADVNTLTLGGFLRKSETVPTDSYKGELDDAGLLNAGLAAADVALIHGLGRTGGIGLDQLDEAQTLLGSPVGSTTAIGAATWRHVSGLAGSVGDYGGTVAGGDAWIITGPSGAGIQVSVPEPSAALAAAGLAAVTLLRRRRASN